MRLALAWFVLLLVLPTAQAEGEEARGDVRASDLHLDGPATARAAAGVADLTPALVTGERLVLSFESATGRMVTTRVQGLDGLWYDKPSTVIQPLSFGPGSLRSFTCDVDCRAAIVAAEDGEVMATGRTFGAVERTTRPLLFCSHYCSPDHPDRGESFFHEVPAGALASPLAGAVPGVAGHVRILLRDLTVVASTREGAETLDLRAERRPHQALGPAGGYEGADRFAVLELQGARLEAPAGSATLLAAPAWRVDLEGALRVSSATGVVTYRGASTRLDGEPLAASGSFLVDAGTKPDVLGKSPFVVSFAGTATMVQAGALVERAPLTVDAASIATVTAGALLLGLAAWLVRTGLTPLYSRLAPSRLLSHPNRALLHERLAMQPGATASDLARDTQLARAVVQHHLRVLEAHQVVGTRIDGRARRYFLREALPDPRTLARRAALRDESRRRIAESLAAMGASTQKGLADATGLSQRLVAYHLAHLESLGLVEGDVGMPRAYRPTALLAQAASEA